MTDNNDELTARRWFREQLTALKAQHPELTDPDHQARLTEEMATWPESPQDDPQDDPQAGG